MAPLKLHYGTKEGKAACGATSPSRKLQLAKNRSEVTCRRHPCRDERNPTTSSSKTVGNGN